jgi:hypothetical protein
MNQEETGTIRKKNPKRGEEDERKNMEKFKCMIF